jgi:hypothetical protein
MVINRTCKPASFMTRCSRIFLPLLILLLASCAGNKVVSVQTLAEGRVYNVHSVPVPALRILSQQQRSFVSQAKK